MYLMAEKYASNYEFSSETDKKMVPLVLEASNMTHLLEKSTPSIYVEVTVAYWRKANAIHSWFVQNVQDGKDECQRSYVEREQLEKLRDTCVQAIEAYKAGDFEKAEELLTPQSGFFFGSTEIDEYYLHDLEYTRDRLKFLLEDEAARDCSFYYQASW